MTGPIDWPRIPDVAKEDPQASVKLELYKAKLEVCKADHQAELDAIKAEEEVNTARAKEDYANFYAISQEFHKGYIEVAKGAIDRSLQRAEFVQKVAAAIGTAYTAVLALSFSIAKDGVPLPLTGIAPTIFLGMAFFLSAAYVSYITKPRHVKAEAPDGTLTGSLLSQRNTFIKWTMAAVTRRMPLLQAAVVSLGIGILCLPFPYLEITTPVFWWLVGIGLGLIVIIPLVSHIVENYISKHDKPDDLPEVATK
jgi:hypothetical protein